MLQVSVLTGDHNNLYNNIKKNSTGALEWYHVSLNYFL